MTVLAINRCLICSAHCDSDYCDQCQPLADITTRHLAAANGSAVEGAVWAVVTEGLSLLVILAAWALYVAVWAVL